MVLELESKDSSDAAGEPWTSAFAAVPPPAIQSAPAVTWNRLTNPAAYSSPGSPAVRSFGSAHFGAGLSQPQQQQQPHVAPPPAVVPRARTSHGSSRIQALERQARAASPLASQQFSFPAVFPQSQQQPHHPHTLTTHTQHLQLNPASAISAPVSPALRPHRPAGAPAHAHSSAQPHTVFQGWTAKSATPRGGQPSPQQPPSRPQPYVFAPPIKALTARSAQTSSQASPSTRPSTRPSPRLRRTRKKSATAENSPMMQPAYTPTWFTGASPASPFDVSLAPIVVPSAGGVTADSDSDSSDSSDSSSASTSAIPSRALSKQQSRHQSTAAINEIETMPNMDLAACAVEPAVTLAATLEAPAATAAAVERSDQPADATPPAPLADVSPPAVVAATLSVQPSPSEVASAQPSRRTVKSAAKAAKPAVKSAAVAVAIAAPVVAAAQTESVVESVALPTPVEVVGAPPVLDPSSVVASAGAPVELEVAVPSPGSRSSSSPAHSEPVSPLLDRSAPAARASTPPPPSSGDPAPDAASSPSLQPSASPSPISTPVAALPAAIIVEGDAIIWTPLSSPAPSPMSEASSPPPVSDSPVASQPISPAPVSSLPNLGQSRPSTARSDVSSVVLSEADSAEELKPIEVHHEPTPPPVESPVETPMESVAAVVEPPQAPAVVLAAPITLPPEEEDFPMSTPEEQIPDDVRQALSEQAAQLAPLTAEEQAQGTIDLAQNSATEAESAVVVAALDSAVGAESAPSRSSRTPASAHKRIARRHPSMSGVISSVTASPRPAAGHERKLSKALTGKTPKTAKRVLSTKAQEQPTQPHSLDLPPSAAKGSVSDSAATVATEAALADASISNELVASSVVEAAPAPEAVATEATVAVEPAVQSATSVDSARAPIAPSHGKSAHGHKKQRSIAAVAVVTTHAKKASATPASTHRSVKPKALTVPVPQSTELDSTIAVSAVSSSDAPTHAIAEMNHPESASSPVGSKVLGTGAVATSPTSAATSAFSVAGRTGGAAVPGLAALSTGRATKAEKGLMVPDALLVGMQPTSVSSGAHGGASIPSLARDRSSSPRMSPRSDGPAISPRSSPSPTSRESFSKRSFHFSVENAVTSPSAGGAASSMQQQSMLQTLSLPPGAAAAGGDSAPAIPSSRRLSWRAPVSASPDHLTSSQILAEERERAERVASFQALATRKMSVLHMKLPADAPTLARPVPAHRIGLIQDSSAYAAPLVEEWRTASSATAGTIVGGSPAPGVLDEFAAALLKHKSRISGLSAREEAERANADLLNAEGPMWGRRRSDDGMHATGNRCSASPHADLSDAERELVAAEAYARGEGSHPGPFSGQSIYGASGVLRGSSVGQQERGSPLAGPTPHAGYPLSMQYHPRTQRPELDVSLTKGIGFDGPRDPNAVQYTKMPSAHTTHSDARDAFIVEANLSHLSMHVIVCLCSWGFGYKNQDDRWVARVKNVEIGEVDNPYRNGKSQTLVEFMAALASAHGKMASAWRYTPYKAKHLAAAKAYDDDVDPITGEENPKRKRYRDALTAMQAAALAAGSTDLPVFPSYEEFECDVRLLEAESRRKRFLHLYDADDLGEDPDRVDGRKSPPRVPFPTARLLYLPECELDAADCTDVNCLHYEEKLLAEAYAQKMAERAERARLKEERQAELDRRAKEYDRWMSLSEKAKEEELIRKEQEKAKQQKEAQEAQERKQAEGEKAKVAAERSERAAVAKSLPSSPDMLPAVVTAPVPLPLAELVLKQPERFERSRSPNRRTFAATGGAFSPPLPVLPPSLAATFSPLSFSATAPSPGLSSVSAVAAVCPPDSYAVNGLALTQLPLLTLVSEFAETPVHLVGKRVDTHSAYKDTTQRKRGSATAGTTAQTATAVSSSTAPVSIPAVAVERAVSPLTVRKMGSSVAPPAAFELVGSPRASNRPLSAHPAASSASPALHAAIVAAQRRASGQEKILPQHRPIDFYI